jgi:hypothetical protein
MTRLALLVVALPAPAFAQADGDGFVWNGIPLGPVLALLATIVTGILGYLSRKIAAANDAARNQATVQAAMVRLGAIAFAMAGDLWDELSREFQARVADGTFDADDRAAFKALIQRKIEHYTTKEELEKLAVAARLPMPGILAWVAEWVIDRLSKAHDPNVTEVAAGAFPVKGGEGTDAG